MVSVFVQLAAYRDPQLVPTVDNMLETADHPELLTFGINWQYGPEEDTGAFDGRGPAFRVLKVPYQESKGLGWARHAANELYRGEDRVLQIDSHMRFLPHWDTFLEEDFQQARLELGADKPVVTTYVPPFAPGQPLPPAHPTLMSQFEFTADKLLRSMPWYIPDFQTLTRVVRARTISAHLLYAEGRFVDEVPYDPALSFGGEQEEVSLSSRAFTHGYDFFSPHRCYAFHEYTRQGRPKVWDDHPVDFYKWDANSRNRTRQLHGQEHHGLELGRYGLGTQRSFHDWEAYAGFDFQRCRLQQYTLDVKEPPNPLPWEEGFVARKHAVGADWDADKIRADCDARPGVPLTLLTLGYETNGGLSLHRADMTPAGHPDVFALRQTHADATFSSCDVPTRWVLWPRFEDGTWGSRQEGPVVKRH